MLRSTFDKFWKLRWRLKAAIMGGAAVMAIVVIAAAAGGGGSEDKKTDAGVKATAEPTPGTTESPATWTPSFKPSTPEPTWSPAPTPEPTVAAPIILSGFGQTATETVTPPCQVCRVTFTHDGTSNFIVHTFRGADEEYLVNAIGPYSGNRPLFGNEPILFDVDADGNWTIRIESVGLDGLAPFSGRGDAVSDLFFFLPGSSAWEFSHDGQSNFIVWVHCSGGSDSVQNEIGPVDGSRAVAFDQPPCVWEVRADGNWSLKPRS